MAAAGEALLGSGTPDMVWSGSLDGGLRGAVSVGPGVVVRMLNRWRPIFSRMALYDSTERG